ncbi:pimeloyl-ACP methyl ester carboxylesterase [Mesonia hippocampi]|uniref:Pimeloyl-ACP methyl ester carboxylesterase n=1 Tax=Mesonia hippocampi TaxID=1628250 RepID=A0A840EH71_9FLAO|nr:alpha/beta hydrolase [Mesonia hippocampi]MBB4117779.1 pimeloyl-ACP methyl ester carboxylesterase [Mesonia hippocampi]
MAVKEEVIHVYFMPGMAANTSIFEYIKLPEDKYRLHYLDWIIPNDDETLSDYVLRLLENVKHKTPILIGVSFGGIIVQEMSKVIAVRKLVIISSVKTKHELPAGMKFAKNTGLYKILPTSLAKHIDKLEQLPVGKTTQKKAKLYKRYLSVDDKKYLDWSIAQVVLWNQEKEIPGIIHIHGDKDAVFPIKNIENCITLKNGTHAMIIYKYRWFNRNLPLILAS